MIFPSFVPMSPPRHEKLCPASPVCLTGPRPRPCAPPMPPPRNSAATGSIPTPATASSASRPTPAAPASIFTSTATPRKETSSSFAAPAASPPSTFPRSAFRRRNLKWCCSDAAPIAMAWHTREAYYLQQGAHRPLMAVNVDTKRRARGREAPPGGAGPRRASSPSTATNRCSSASAPIRTAEGYPRAPRRPTAVAARSKKTGRPARRK